jgi:carboxyl-terminal processing protease
VLQELGLAKVVGTQTAGCVGTGQLFPLPNGGGIQITVARLVTGKGKMLNGIGVTPNVDVPMSVQDLVAGRDPQLSRALQVLQSGH